MKAGTKIDIYVHNSLTHNSPNVESSQRPSVDEWISKMWYLRTTEYYSAIKGREF